MDTGKDHKGDSVYNMNYPRRGIAVIINNRKFGSTGMEAQKGIDIDAANLNQAFKGLGFDIKLINNLTCQETRSEIQNGMEWIFMKGF